MESIKPCPSVCPTTAYDNFWTKCPISFKQGNCNIFFIKLRLSWEKRRIIQFFAISSDVNIYSSARSDWKIHFSKYLPPKRANTLSNYNIKCEVMENERLTLNLAHPNIFTNMVWRWNISPITPCGTSPIMDHSF